MSAPLKHTMNCLNVTCYRCVSVCMCLKGHGTDGAAPIAGALHLRSVRGGRYVRKRGTRGEMFPVYPKGGSGLKANGLLRIRGDKDTIRVIVPSLFKNVTFKLHYQLYAQQGETTHVYNLYFNYILISSF